MSELYKNLQDQMHGILNVLEPHEALTTLGPVLKKLLAQLDEEERVNYILDLVGHEDSDKLSSMVHL